MGEPEKGRGLWSVSRAWGSLEASKDFSVWTGTTGTY